MFNIYLREKSPFNWTKGGNVAACITNANYALPKTVLASSFWEPAPSWF